MSRTPIAKAAAVIALALAAVVPVVAAQQAAPAHRIVANGHMDDMIWQ